MNSKIIKRKKGKKEKRKGKRKEDKQKPFPAFQLRFQTLFSLL